MKNNDYNRYTYVCMYIRNVFFYQTEEIKHYFFLMRYKYNNKNNSTKKRKPTIQSDFCGFTDFDSSIKTTQFI